MYIFIAGVAQLEAQATCNRQVVGSSPTTGSTQVQLLTPVSGPCGGFAASDHRPRGRKPGACGAHSGHDATVSPFAD